MLLVLVAMHTTATVLVRSVLKKCGHSGHSVHQVCSRDQRVGAKWCSERTLGGLGRAVQRGVDGNWLAGEMYNRDFPH